MKGDVYSFAIICQEIVYRKGQFWVDDGHVTVNGKQMYQIVKSTTSQKLFSKSIFRCHLRHA